ncbi:MAG TPA: ABC transporter permease [Blastocatellia bacterium]|nr:ABC transporter permease [Blastocatellia bacterium]
MTILLTAAGTALALWAGDFIHWMGGGSTAKVIVLNQEILPFQLPAKSGIELVPAAGRSDEEWRAAVGRKEVAGLLVLHSIDQAELLVYKQPVWQPKLMTALSSARREARLKMAGLSPQELDLLLAPFQIDVRFHETGGQPAKKAETIFALFFIALVIAGVFTGTAYLFAGITGEKQLRVTEQVVAAISPQTWIDGKILGLSGMALISVLSMGGGAVLVVLAAKLFGASLPIPLEMIHPALLLQFLTMAVLGFLLWLTFFAAIAATINDPQTSMRSAAMFLPFLPLSLAFPAFKNPDTWLMKLLGIMPFSSPAVMPARLVLTDVAWWEFLAATVLLLGTIWMLRRTAGKIFGMGVLMYGKEPSWREMWRWAREA